MQDLIKAISMIKVTSYLNTCGGTTIPWGVNILIFLSLHNKEGPEIWKDQYDKKLKLMTLGHYRTYLIGFKELQVELYHGNQH